MSITSDRPGFSRQDRRPAARSLHLPGRRPAGPGERASGAARRAGPALRGRDPIRGAGAAIHADQPVHAGKSPLSFTYR
jgi:hypothetical protein